MNIHCCRELPLLQLIVNSILTIKCLKIEVGCLLFFSPLWECSAVGSAAAACSSGVCPLDLACVKLALPGGSMLSSSVVVQHG